MFKAKKAFRKFFKFGKKMAYQIDQRSIQCWVKSKLQSALGYVHTVPDSETERRRKCTG